MPPSLKNPWIAGCDHRTFALAGTRRLGDFIDPYEPGNKANCFTPALLVQNEQAVIPAGYSLYNIKRPLTIIDLDDPKDEHLLNLYTSQGLDPYLENRSSLIQYVNNKKNNRCRSG